MIKGQLYQFIIITIITIITTVVLLVLLLLLLIINRVLVLLQYKKFCFFSLEEV